MTDGLLPEMAPLSGGIFAGQGDVGPPDVMPVEFVDPINEEALAEEVRQWKAAKEVALQRNEPEPLPPLNRGQRSMCRQLMPALWEIRRYRLRGVPRKQYAKDLEQAHQLCYCLWGAAGTGKTEMLKVLEMVMLRESLGRIVFSAWMGVAAALLPHGMTMCSATGLSPAHFNMSSDQTAKASQDNLTGFVARCGKQEDVVLWVIDEMSTWGAKYLYHFGNRTCELVDGDPTVPLGGSMVLVLGDFLQLPPVGETGLYESVVRKLLTNVPSASGKRVVPKKKKVSPLSAAGKGTTMFINFKFVRLTEQMRARLDGQWCEWMDALRDLTTSSPVPAALVERLKTLVLSASEMNDPQYAFASMATVSQKEAAEYNWLMTVA